MNTYILRLDLQDSDPPIWRQMKIPGRYRLPQVHRMMQDLFDWQDYHLHDFVVGDITYADPEMLDFDEFDAEDENITLEVALGKQRSILYRYDFGDSWEVSAQVMEVLPEDSDGPECLAGERAGPPEDCGGIPGLANLIAVLSNPKDPEYDEMRTWVGAKYDPDRFPLESINKRLRRQFGRKPKKAKTPKDAVLGGYLLAKLKTLQMMVAALEVRPGQTLDDVANTLENAGVSLPAGSQSLKRAMAQSSAIRTKSDGTLELNVGPQLEDVKRWMDLAHVDFWANVPKPQATPHTAPVLATGPLTHAELESVGHLPWSVSLRRGLTIATDVLGGRARTEEAIELMKPRSEHFRHAFDLKQSLSGGQHLRHIDGYLELDRDHPQTEKARQEVRSRLPSPVDHQREQEQKARGKERQEQRKEDRRQRRDSFAKARKAVLAGPMGTIFALAVFDVQTGEITVFNEALRDQARDVLGAYDYLIGLDPKSSLERLNWQLDTPCHDITPPFKSVPVSRTRRKKLLLPKAVKMSVGQEVNPEKWDALVSKKKPSQIESQLRKDVTNLYYYWRFGVIHGALLRHNEWMPVIWNMGIEMPLRYALEYSIEDKAPIELTRKNHFRGPFVPQRIEGDRDRSLVSGVWLDSNISETIPLREILDFRYSAPLSDERFQKYAWILG